MRSILKMLLIPSQPKIMDINFMGYSILVTTTLMMMLLASGNLFYFFYSFTSPSLAMWWIFFFGLVRFSSHPSSFVHFSCFYFLFGAIFTPLHGTKRVFYIHLILMVEHQNNLRAIFCFFFRMLVFSIHFYSISLALSQRRAKKWTEPTAIIDL